MKQLLARRVPQILGLYVAATWMTVEISEWVTEQMGWPGELVFYAFVLMIALVPSVIVLAWNHGAPGRDEWRPGEKVILPANLLVAIVGVAALIGLSPPGSGGSGIAQAQGATVERTLVDETGREQTFQVAREGYHKRVAAFFWPAADDSVSWESYAVPWLLAADLGRDPLLSVVTTYEMQIRDELAAAGYQRAVGEPLSLDLRLARKVSAELLVRGRFERHAGGYRLAATVTDAATGRAVAEHSVEAPALVDAAAALADALAPTLYGDVERDPEAFVDIELSEASTASPEALRAFVEGINAWYFENDYPAAIDHLEAAVGQDPEFALAYMWMSQIYRFDGRMGEASQAISSALEYDYKLDSETLFMLKANRYAVTGDFDKAMRVLRMWTEVHPNSYQAFVTLARNMLLAGDIQAARDALDVARELDPGNATVDRFMATVEELDGDYRAAAMRLEAYIDSEPDDAEARVDLAQMQSRAGNFEAAREAFEQAQFLTGESFDADLGLAMVDARAGKLESALASLEALAGRVDTPQRHAVVVLARVSALAQVGRIREALENLEGSEDLLRQAMAPVNYATQIGEWRAELLSNLGRNRDALAALDTMAGELSEPFNRFLAFNRVMIYSRMDDVEGVARAIENLSYFQDNFNYPGLQAFLDRAEATLLRMQGETGRAVELMRDGLEVLRKSPLALNDRGIESYTVGLATHYRADGRLDAARTVLEDLLDRHPAHGQARLELAGVEHAAGNDRQARHHLDRLLEQWANADSDYVAYQEARAMRDRL